MKKLFLLYIVLIAAISSPAQYHFSSSHFTSDNGLSQNNITAMMKDRKGYLWFGTLNGLNKYDGTNFTIYKPKPDKWLSASNIRIKEIKEDNQGFVWIKTFDDMVYRLNQYTEELNRIQKPNGDYIREKIREIYILPSGVIWLTTFNKGCYKVQTNDLTHQLTVTLFNKAHKTLSNDNVSNIFQDMEGNTWFLTQNGLNCIKVHRRTVLYFNSSPFYSYNENSKRILFGSDGMFFEYDKRTKTFKAVKLPYQVTVFSISSLNSNYYLFATHENGFFTYDVLQKKLQLFSREKNHEMKSNDIQNVYIDQTGDAWLGIKSQGILHFTVQSNKIAYIESGLNEGQVANPNSLIFEDDRKLLWVQPYYGFFSWFDRVNNRLIPFYNAWNEDINNEISYGVNHILSDSQGIFWISTNRGNGFFKCAFLPDYFNHYLFQNYSANSISNETTALYEDHQNRLWVACKDGLVHVFDENKNEIGTLNTDGRILPGGHLEVLVNGFCQDKAGNIWFASKNQGLFRLTPLCSKNAFRIENFLHNPTDNYSPANNDFYSIVQDNNGRIWAGSYGGGLHLIDEQNGKIRFFHSYNELKSYPEANHSKVRQVFVDSRKHIWVATTGGFVVFSSDFRDPKEIKYRYNKRNENKGADLSVNDVFSIFEDEDATIWFSTLGGGLNKLTKRIEDKKQFIFEVFDRRKGLPNNAICSIIDDKQGNLWLTTENSIVKFNKKTGLMDTFGNGNEPENVEFSETSACLLHSGEIYVGSKSGFYYFHPEKVKRRMLNAPLVLTRLTVYNKEVEIRKKGSLLKTQLDKTSYLEFNNNENAITIEFATLDMRAPEKIQYAYMLDGFDPEWNKIHTRHYATYTALPPGRYTFRVKSTDSEGVWLQNERQIVIYILPSFWQSGLAKVLYVFTGVLLFLIILYLCVRISNLKNKVHLEKQTTDIKLKSLTDISGELLTPLTLISLPMDNQLHKYTDPELKDQLLQVRSNLNRVTDQINQILDFRKIQNNKLKLSVEEINFADFTRSYSHNFLKTASFNSIGFDLIDESKNIKLWVDPERYKSILSILLSNAFKFTPSEKNITVKTEIKQNVAVLSVTDQGSGIDLEKMNFINDNFLDFSTLSNRSQKNIGIGLELVKKLVDLHHGSIHLNNQPGKGSTFEIEFKLGTAHYDGEVELIFSDQKFPVKESCVSKLPLESEKADQLKVIPLILIVDDNEELRHFLKKSLKKSYRVIEAENGMAGWTKIKQVMPDFIIADLLMHVSDGMELSVKVKEDARTSHIPVILLTGMTDNEIEVAGMKAGADEYITKPFSSELLHERIGKLVQQRIQIQHYCRSQFITSKPDSSVSRQELKSPNDRFMQTLILLLNDNLGNPDLNIDLLASGLNMSRTILFNKIKSLTGFSPVEFVHEVRFERAVGYILDTRFSISEISYKVGIQDPRYFSRCFKQKYGTTPSEYRNRRSI